MERRSGRTRGVKRGRNESLNEGFEERLRLYVAEHGGHTGLPVSQEKSAMSQTREKVELWFESYWSLQQRSQPIKLLVVGEAVPFPGEGDLDRIT